MKADVDKSIDNLSCLDKSASDTASARAQDSPGGISTPTASEMNAFYSELNKCEPKPVALSLIKPHAEAFVKKSRDIVTRPDLFDRKYLDFSYPDLLKDCNQKRHNVTSQGFKFLHAPSWVHWSI